MNQITAQGTGSRLHAKAKIREHSGHQIGTDQRFRNHLRSQEQPLEQQPMQIEARAALTADSWSRETATGLLHQIVAASHVTTGWSDRASEVLNKRTGDQIRSHCRRLLLFHELAIAVVDEADAVGLPAVDPLTKPADGLHAERGAPAVPTTALNQHQSAGLIEHVINSLLIHRTIRTQRQFLVGNAEVPKGSLPLTSQTDHLFQGVVGTPSDGHHAIARTKHSKQGCSNGMGTADELQSHRCGFCAQHPGEHPIDHLPPLIAVAITAHRGEVLNPHPFRRKSVQNPSQPGRNSGGSRSGDWFQALANSLNACSR